MLRAFLCADGGEADSCRKCDSTGLRACKQHEKSECDLEDGVFYCTEFYDCEFCSGTGWVDCEKCDNHAAAEEFESQLAERARKAEEHAWIHEAMGRPLRLAETEHFRLVWELDSLKVDKKRKNGHELLHLYGKRLDSLFEDFVEVLASDSKHFKDKPLVLVWGLIPDQLKSSRVFCGASNRGGSKMLGSEPKFSCCGNKQFAKSDDELHRTLVHNVVHLLLSHQSPSFWIGNVKGGWVDAGLAHWFEDRYWKRCTNYCYQEQNTMIDFKRGKYRVAVRKLVAQEKTVPTAVVFLRNTDTLTPVEHALSFSYVDYLLSIDGEKFSGLVRMLKKRKSTREALKSAYGLNLFEFESGWKAWVLETYPKR